MGDMKETKLIIKETKFYKLRGKYANSYSSQFANDHVIATGICT